MRLSFEEARSYVRKEYERIGQDDLRWYQPEYWLTRLGINMTAQQIIEGYRHEIRIYAEVPRVLDRLGDDHVLVIASNNPREFLDVQVEAIGEHFERVFSSVSDFQLARKSTDFYVAICEELNVNPTEMAHIGDHEVFDMRIPRKIGIRAFFLDRSGSRRGKFTVEDLNEFTMRLSMLRGT